MKIKSLQLKNFKRFTDLQLQNIPEGTKLVLLIGANGSGKSSVFDAFGYLSNQNGKASNESFDFRKRPEFPMEVFFETHEYGVEGIFDRQVHRSGKLTASSFYGRTSFRQVPRLTRRQLGNSVNIITDSDRAPSFIDKEERFENDIEHILGKLLKEFFRTDNDKSQIKSGIVDPINKALERIFETQNGTRLHLVEIIPPLEGKTAEINFQKGAVTFHYNFLSAGEKEVFNILINLIARREYYQNTLYFFDEIDLHLHTRLQYNLLKEITENWIPANCQLWTASHSLGFIDYANDFKEAVIFDFDDLDFDLPQTLQPIPKNDNEIFEIAVGRAFIDKFVQGRKTIFSENTDTPYYNDLGLDNMLFFTAIDKADAFHKAKNLKQSALIDRDFLGDEELTELKETYPFLYILPFYSFENLLFHPDNLEEYLASQNLSFDKKKYVEALTEIKNKEKDSILIGILMARSGYPFYKENENSKKLNFFRENHKSIVDLLKSDNLNDFYKIFPMKNYATQLNERQNISKTALARTKWFKQQIASILT